MRYSLAALALLPAIATVLAFDGGYFQTCFGQNLNGTLFTASCYTEHGSIDISSLDLNRCIANDNGHIAVCYILPLRERFRRDTNGFFLVPTKVIIL